MGAAPTDFADRLEVGVREREQSRIALSLDLSNLKDRAAITEMGTSMNAAGFL